MILKFSLIILIIRMFLCREPKKIKFEFESEESEEEERTNKEYQKKLQEFEKKMQIHQHTDKNIILDPNFIKYKEQVINEIIKRSAWSPDSSSVSDINTENNNDDTTHSFLELTRIVPESDNPNKFFNHTFERNINKLPSRGRVERKPWSGSYWPMKNGILSVRYGKNEKNTVSAWDPRQRRFTYDYKYLESVGKYKQPDEHNKQSRYANFEQYVFDNYSPSEKFDLFMGDTSYTLTNWNKKEGDKYVKEYKGDLPTWFGICHGWAPAAYYHKKPVKPVNVTSADGRTRITFLPDDIKALASLHFANLNYKTNFVGAICKVYPPKKPIADNSTGLWMENMCHAINPGSLVIIMGNHVGIKRQNLVLDPLSDHEVWNQPIVSYKLRYYNLITQDFFSSPRKAKVPVEYIKGSRDNFLNLLGKQSNSKTSTVIGVYFNITYIYETAPNHGPRSMDDYEKNDQFVGAIQLDKDDNIIGGEWKYNAHPNFIWHYDTRFPLQSCCDDFVKTFDGKVTPTVTRWAKETSKKGQIIKSVIEYLVNRSAIEEKNEDKDEDDFYFEENKDMFSVNSTTTEVPNFSLINTPLTRRLTPSNAYENSTGVELPDDLANILWGL